MHASRSETVVHQELITMVSNAFHFNLAPQAKYGMRLFPNAFAHSELFGTGLLVFNVQVDKYISQTPVASALVEHSSMGSSVTPFLLTNAQVSSTLFGTELAVFAIQDMSSLACNVPA